MGYTGPYALHTRCFSEFLATAIAIFLVLATFANLLLPGTKGHGMDFPFVAIGVGLAYFVPNMMLNHISAMSNPAMALASAVAGRIDWADFPAISAAELVGGFAGAVCMWLAFLPYFKTVPEPQGHVDDQLLRRRDILQPTALQVWGGG